MGEGDFLGDQQLEQGLRQVAARVHLLDAQQRRHIGHAPGVHVEHGRDRHVDVVLVETSMPGTGQRGAAGEGVQHQLPVGEVHALGQAGGAGGVEGGGAGVFVQLREIELGRGLLQQGFVLAGDVQLGIQVAAFVVQQHVAFDGFDAVFQLFENRQKLAVHQNHVVLGVVQGVENLFRAQAHVHRVQHRAHHRDGEERFQVTVGVPVHHRHGVAGLDPALRQRAGEPVDPLFQIPVAHATLVRVDDLLLGSVTHAGFQNAVDHQRRFHRFGGALNGQVVTHCSLHHQTKIKK